MDERQPHRRYNPLTGEWVLVSPHRLDRPWRGEQSPEQVEPRPHYDPDCALCPGNVRANGARNPAYEGTFVFENDFAALRAGVPAGSLDENGLFVAQSESGRARVVCFSPRHDLDISSMPVAAVRSVIDTWAQQTEDLLAEPDIASVMVFENRGAAMGASIPHPHSQVWANESVPNEVLKEREGFGRYESVRGRCLLCAYAQAELKRSQRIVYQNEFVCVAVPFWAVWPFETLILPRAHRASLSACTAQERDALAAAMHALTGRYDALFGVPFPYSMGWHQEQHLHAHYYPPLLRSAGVRKYMVGYEMLAQPQRDLTPEDAAKRLRE